MGKSNVVKVNFKGIKVLGDVKAGPNLLTVDKVSVEKGSEADFLKWQYSASTGGKVWENTSLAPQSLWRLRGMLIALGLEVPEKSLTLDLKGYEGLQMGANIELEKYQGKEKGMIIKMYPAEDFEGEGGDAPGEDSYLSDLDDGQLRKLVVEADLAKKAKAKNLDTDELLALINEADVEEVDNAAVELGYLDPEPGDFDIETLEDDDLKALAVAMELTTKIKAKKLNTKKLLALFEDADEDDVLTAAVELDLTIAGEPDEPEALDLDDLDEDQLRDLAIELGCVKKKDAKKLNGVKFIKLINKESDEDIATAAQELGLGGEAVVPFDIDEADDDDLRLLAVEMDLAKKAAAKKLKGAKLKKLFKGADDDDIQTAAGELGLTGGSDDPEVGDKVTFEEDKEDYEGEITAINVKKGEYTIVTEDEDGEASEWTLERDDFEMA